MKTKHRVPLLRIFKLDDSQLTKGFFAKVGLCLVVIPLCLCCSSITNSSKSMNIKTDSAYESYDYGFIEKAFFHIIYNEAFEVGVSLKLNNDSTYSLKNCGGVSKGVYTIIADSLFLKELSFFNSFDSNLYSQLDTVHGYRIINENILLSKLDCLSTSGKTFTKTRRLKYLD